MGVWSVWLNLWHFSSYKWHVNGNSCLYYSRLLLLNVNFLCVEFTGNSLQFILGNSIWPFGLKLLYTFSQSVVSCCMFHRMQKYFKTEEVIMLINFLTPRLHMTLFLIVIEFLFFYNSLVKSKLLHWSMCMGSDVAAMSWRFVFRRFSTILQDKNVTKTGNMKW